MTGIAAACSIRYRAEAIHDLKCILDYGLAQGHRDPKGFLADLRKRIGLLSENPEAGLESPDEPRTRELILRITKRLSFVAFYEFDAVKRRVTVTRVLHNAHPLSSESPP